MQLRINGQKDVVAGACFAIVGVVLFFWSYEYQMGTALQMGPGYFPRLCAIMLFFLGVAAVVKGVLAKVPDPIPYHKVEPLFLILASIISFALLIERAGLVVATFVCLLFACFRRVLTNPIEVFLMFVALTVFNVAVFVYAFEITIPIFWWDK